MYKPALAYKAAAAQRWVSAVNHHGGFGRWGFVVCRDPTALPKILEMKKAGE
ncbi:MAG: hypothetical protein GTN49_01475 [candidate division Zixibacteria bacterium]|nr:hypothetical protein [candidate division Zixibacteria bacterium]